MNEIHKPRNMSRLGSPIFQQVIPYDGSDMIEMDRWLSDEIYMCVYTPATLKARPAQHRTVKPRIISRPEQTGRHFADDIFKHFFEWNIWYLD